MQIHRSMLILPVNVPKFVEKAYSRGADAIMLDLEDSVPPSEKVAARNLLSRSVDLAGKGGSEVFVRVNNEPDLLEDDLKSAVLPGVHAVFLPKTESAEQVKSFEAMIRALESEQGLPVGAIRLSLHIESPRGILNLQEIARASQRTESMSIGTDDYCLQLGVDPSKDGMEMLFPLSTMVTVCKAEGLSPMGILGTVAGYRDLEGFERAAQRGRQLGCTGAYCIHPDQVAVLNKVFTPPPERVEHSKRIVEVFEAAMAQGRASTTLDNKMVDTPIYKRAKYVLEKALIIKDLESRKKEASAGIDTSGNRGLSS